LKRKKLFDVVISYYHGSNRKKYEYVRSCGENSSAISDNVKIH